MTKDELNEKVEDFVPTTQTFSPYEVAKFASLLKGDLVREQMLYQYVSKGRIPSSMVEGKIRIQRDDVVTWLVKYLTRFLVEETAEIEVEVVEETI